MIKNIIFDLNKVITTFDKSSNSDEVYKKELGISREDFWKDRDKILEDYTLGKVSLDEYISSQLRKSSISLDKQEIAKKIHNQFLTLVDEIIPVIEKLSKSYNLILMAGEGKESLEIKLDKFKLRKYFSKIYATYTVKMDKTETKFYSLILSENNLKPDETIFIDDQQRYIDAAKKVGPKTIKFENIMQLKQELFRALS